MRLFKWSAVVVFALLVLTLLGIALWCALEGDWKGAVGWFICAGLVGLPCRYDPAIQWKDRQRRS